MTTYMLGCRSRVNEIVSYSTSSNRITEEVNILHHIHRYWRLICCIPKNTWLNRVKVRVCYCISLCLRQRYLPGWICCLHLTCGEAQLKVGQAVHRRTFSFQRGQPEQLPRWSHDCGIHSPPPSPLTVAQSLSCNTWNFSSFLSFQFHRHDSATHYADCRVNVTF